MDRPSSWLGVIMAGGKGTRLGQLSAAVNKHLLPVHDKPMIYYPLSLAIQCGCHPILIITNPSDVPAFRKLLGTGKAWGVHIAFVPQERPAGIAEAPLLVFPYWRSSHTAMLLLLGDNLFLDPTLPDRLLASSKGRSVCVLHHVPDIRPYGAARLDDQDRILSLVEKPQEHTPGWAITGAYVLDRKTCSIAPHLAPSPRGELEILDLLSASHAERRLHWIRVEGKWIDMGSPNPLRTAARWVEAYQDEYEMVGSPELASALAGLKSPQELLRSLTRATDEYQRSLERAFARHFPRPESSDPT